MAGDMVLTADAKIIFQTVGFEPLLRILAGESIDYTRQVPVRKWQRRRSATHANPNPLRRCHARSQMAHDLAPVI
jgi:hypothetical protein